MPNLLGNRSAAHNKSPYTGTTNRDIVTDHDYNDTINVKRDYRIQKSNKKTNISSDEVQVRPRDLDDEYLSKAQRFVERNQVVIESGAMFQMQPIPKTHLRFKDISLYMCLVKS